MKCIAAQARGDPRERIAKLRRTIRDMEDSQSDARAECDALRVDAFKAKALYSELQREFNRLDSIRDEDAIMRDSSAAYIAELTRSRRDYHALDKTKENYEKAKTLIQDAKYAARTSARETPKRGRSKESSSSDTKRG